MTALALIYQKGKGTEKNISKAVELLSQASQSGETSAMIELAQMYKNGIGLERDIDAVLDLYERAALLGSSDAMISLGFPMFLSFPLKLTFFFCPLRKWFLFFFERQPICITVENIMFHKIFPKPSFISTKLYHLEITWPKLDYVFIVSFLNAFSFPQFEHSF